MNLKYGKIVGGEIVYAPSALSVEGTLKVNPSEASYLAAGWKKVKDEPPEAEEGRHVEPTGWTETEAEVVRVYEQREGAREAAAGPRTFSKLKMLVALKKRNLWVLTKTWIEEHGLYDFYLAAQFFTEDNEYFVQGRTELQRFSGISDSTIEEILAESIAE